MGFGNFFGGDKSATQTTQNLQVGVQGGGTSSVTTATGGVSGASSASGQGNITGGIHGYQGSEIHINTNDPSTAIAAIESNQALSNLAISDANSNATQALQTLQELGHQLAQVAVGNSPTMTVGPPADGVVSTPHYGTYAMIAGVIILSVVLYVTLKK